MTKAKMLYDIELYKAGDITKEDVEQSLNEYCESQNSGKPIVSGSLPSDTKAEVVDVLEKLIQNSHSIDADGEPTAPILDIVDTWIKARDLLCRLRQ